MIVIKNEYVSKAFIRISHPEGTDTDQVQIETNGQHVWIRPVGEAIISIRYGSATGYERVTKIFCPGNYSLKSDSDLYDANGVHIPNSSSLQFNATFNSSVNVDSSGLADITIKNLLEISVYVRISNNGGEGSESIYAILPNASDSWKRKPGALYKMQFFFNPDDPSKDMLGPVHHLVPGNDYHFIRGEQRIVSIRNSDDTSPRQELGYFHK